jgi:micrococcal nuclease
LALLLPSALLAERSPRTLPAEVLWITDGDTIVIHLQGHKEKVRLIGIDAPECRPNPKAEKDAIRTGDDLRTITEMGRRSTRYVKGMIRPGDHVQIELDLGERDRYGRLLAYIWLADGRMLNEEIVRAGYANLITYPPNVKYQKRFQEAYRQAREGKKGLWGP